MKYKEELIAYYKSMFDKSNEMFFQGWYDPFYAIFQTFSLNEIMLMSELEIQHLVQLAEKLVEVLFE